jgi:hypothetical protein
MTTKPTQRFGAALPFEVETTTPRLKTDTKTDDARFIDALAKAIQAQDDTDETETETPPEDREALKAEIRQEVIAELGERIRKGTSKPPPEPAPPRAGFVRDESLTEFFELCEAEKEIRRARRGH